MKIRPLHVLAVVRSKAVEAVLSDARAALRGMELSLRFGEVSDLYPSTDLLQAPDVLVLEIDAQEPRDLDALEHISRRHFSGVPILVTAAEAPLPLVRRLIAGSRRRSARAGCGPCGRSLKG